MTEDGCSLFPYDEHQSKQIWLSQSSMRIVSQLSSLFCLYRELKPGIMEDGAKQYNPTLLDHGLHLLKKFRSPLL
ncbi:hypothetical protein EGR_11220 [Echinococcus granulosus]|uniref:Uncharacterized protein n=1 Tax=Echinococcus granulosus TaxID=6210 RepID=W6TYW9_ECHGR|nr:hypothetical protein EGR_11220 [Echinococcus granulosus]EUB53923.1 hypothetical protein EGR_11220 [Echinococcus granulosus]